MSDGTAKKRDPRSGLKPKPGLAEKMGGHSARPMQLAVYYKDAGGTYEGKEVQGQQALKMVEEDWGTREEYEKEKK